MPSCEIHKIKCKVPECESCPRCIDTGCEHVKTKEQKLMTIGRPGKVKGKECNTTHQRRSKRKIAPVDYNEEKSDSEDMVIRTVKDIRDAFEISGEQKQFPSKKQRNEENHIDYVKGSASMVNFVSEVVEKVSSVVYPANSNSLISQLASRIQKKNDEPDSISAMKVCR